MAHTIDESREFDTLQIYKKSRTRWLSQHEFDRHKELFIKKYS